MALPDALQHPARVVPVAFLGLTAIGTALLMVPGTTTDGTTPPFLVALFTATSAVTVTGLVVVPTQEYWSPGGHVVIVALCQIGGFGIMAFGTILALGISRRLGLRLRLVAAAETGSIGLGDLKFVLRNIVLTVLACEAVIAAVLIARLAFVLDDPWDAVWQGAFHAVSAFNNAGFAIWPGGTQAYASDYVLLGTVGLAVVFGSLGFPVIRELTHEWRHPSTWTVHTRLTVWGTLALLLLGTGLVMLFEWSNPATLGPDDAPDKVLHSFFLSAQSRSGGFSTFDTAHANSETLLTMDGLMFIGGGSAGVAGGIKVTTFLLLLFVIVAEVRGHGDVVVGNRRIPERTQRLAISIALLGIAVVGAGTLALVALGDQPVEYAVFEATSAFATVGLSTGVTGDLPQSGQLVLVVLMLIGRVGTVTAASAFALAHRPRLYRLPEERPIVG